jgi:hypothetical protein
MKSGVSDGAGAIGSEPTEGEGIYAGATYGVGATEGIGTGPGAPSDGTGMPIGTGGTSRGVEYIGTEGVVTGKAASEDIVIGTNAGVKGAPSSPVFPIPT